jgi:PAS domain S-box-containing protein
MRWSSPTPAARSGSGTRRPSACSATVASEAVGQSLDLLIPERFRPAHDAGFTRAVATGQLRTGTRVLRTRSNHKDGRRLYVDFTFALLKAPDGRVVAVYALARDATEAHVQQQAATQGNQA